MTDTKKEEKKAVKYFRSTVAGLSVVVGYVGDENNDPTSVRLVRFTPYYDTWKGDRIKVGYLETDNKVAIEKLKAVYEVEEIDEAEYKKAVEGDAKNKPLEKAPIAAV